MQKLIRVKECNMEEIDSLLSDDWIISSISATRTVENIGSSSKSYTYCYVLLEKDIKVEPKPKRSNKKRTVAPEDAVLDGLPDTHKVSFKKWLVYKQEKGEGYVPTGLKTQISRVIKKFPSHLAFSDAVDFSIANGYKGIFEPSSNYSKPDKTGLKKLSINNTIKAFKEDEDGW